MIKFLLAAFVSLIVIGCVSPKLQNAGKIDDSKCDTAAQCNDTGVKYELQGNLDAAQKYYETACDGKIGVACSNLGSIYQSKNNKSESEILAIFLKSCEFGSKYGCYNAANLYRLSKTPDYGKALKLYEKSCTLMEHAQSCSNLGGMYQFSLGIKVADSKTAKNFYKMGCEMGDEIGCRNLSLIGDE